MKHYSREELLELANGQKPQHQFIVVTSDEGHYHRVGRVILLEGKFHTTEDAAKAHPGNSPETPVLYSPSLDKFFCGYNGYWGTDQEMEDFLEKIEQIYPGKEVEEFPEDYVEDSNIVSFDQKELDEFEQFASALDTAASEIGKIIGNFADELWLDGVSKETATQNMKDALNDYINSNQPFQ